MGLTYHAYAYYERGAYPFTVEQVFRLSRILGRSVQWLLGLDTELSDDQDELLTLYHIIEDPDRKAMIRETAKLFSRSYRAAPDPAENHTEQ